MQARLEQDGAQFDVGVNPSQCATRFAPKRTENAAVAVTPVECSTSDWPAGATIDRNGPEPMIHSDWLWDLRSECDDCIGRRSIYLTFDDGPHPLCTPQILNLLAEHRVPATFFVIGAYALGQPELIQRMVAEGHEVGNHTMTHPDLSRCGFDEVQREIFDANAAIMMACPQASVRHLRAPYGNWTEEVFAASAIAELAAIKWSVDPRDWSRPGVDTIVDAVLESAKPGAIVRLHDGFPPDELLAVSGAGLRDQTVTAVSRLIPALLERGFQIRSLPHFD